MISIILITCLFHNEFKLTATRFHFFPFSGSFFSYLFLSNILHIHSVQVLVLMLPLSSYMSVYCRIHHHCFISTYHASPDMTDMGFHTSVAGTFCLNFLHFQQNGKEMWLSRTISNTECLLFGW